VNKLDETKKKFLYLFADEIVDAIVIFLRDCFPSRVMFPFSPLLMCWVKSRPFNFFLKTGSSYLFSFPHDFKRKGGGKDDGSAASMTSIL
jgi:hypothetical protein